MAAIDVKNLSKKFQEVTSVNNISFNINYGEITALVGSNGAGKSTTLNMIAGILMPSAGEITFDGLDFTNNYKAIKSKLGYLTCDMALYDTFSVEEVFTFLGKLKGMERKPIINKIAELAERFSLQGILEKSFSELSSGQKQRSLIAASVLHDPAILIFDEVTASLDLVACKDIMDFLKEQKKKGKAIIFSTHILSEVEYLSDRILVIEKGMLVQDTTCQKMLSLYNSQNLTDAFYNVLCDLRTAA